MLAAEHQGQRVLATAAERGPDYTCPLCKRTVILKRGRKVIAHFAHKPPTTCLWARGETRAHLGSKKIVYDALTARSLRAAVEYVVDTLPGDRRADVMTWSPSGIAVAFELQHTPIGLDEIERRSRSYARVDIAQLWIPFLHDAALRQAEHRGAGSLFIERYSARPFEKWVHGLHGKDGMWMYVPREKAFRHARMAGHQIYVEESSWYEAGGVEASAGGYYRWSKRYRELSLSSKKSIEDLRLVIKSRREMSLDTYNWPAGRMGFLV
jgi:competence CoiA-like predicted nuclease